MKKQSGTEISTLGQYTASLRPELCKISEVVDLCQDSEFLGENLSSLQPPSLLNLVVVGLGRHSIVLRGTLRSTFANVAVKCVRKDLPIQPSPHLAAEYEAKLLARLSHPNIVAIHDVLHLETLTCIILDLGGSPHTQRGQLCDDIGGRSSRSISNSPLKENYDSPRSQSSGTLTSNSTLSTVFHEQDMIPPGNFNTIAPRHDLFEFLERNGTLSEKIAKIVFRQIVDAVEFLHKNNVCHMDIKDENVLIDRRTLHVTLIDFGSAVDSFDLVSGIRGTAGYNPPEAIENLKPYDPRGADAWALGALLFVLLNLLPAFDDAQDVLFCQARPYERHLSEAAKMLISRLLRKNPTTRWKISDIQSSKWINTD